MRLTLSAVTIVGLSVALFQDLPVQGQMKASPSFEVVATPNNNPNSELFAASASSRNDIWAVGQSTMHFDGTRWTAFPAPMIKGDNNSFLQGVVAYFSPFGMGGGKCGQRGTPWAGDRTVEWNQVELVSGPKVREERASQCLRHDC